MVICALQSMIEVHPVSRSSYLSESSLLFPSTSKMTTRSNYNIWSANQQSRQLVQAKNPGNLHNSISSIEHHQEACFSAAALVILQDIGL